MQQFPGIDRTLIEEHVRLGYTTGEIKDILDAMGENANNAGYRPGDPRRTRSINAALAALLQRFVDALNNGQYDALFNAGYTQNEIRTILFTNLLPTARLLVRTAEAHASGEYYRLHQFGSTDVEIRSLIYAGFTVSQLRALASRVNAAQRNGVDSQGLTLQHIDDMLFKKRSMNSVRTLGVVPALLSGVHSKVCEGDVARCIIEYVTMFDVPYGLGGADGQVDVGTQHIIVEVKVDSVTDGQLGQYVKIMTNDVMNPPDANGKRKSVILYAPGYSKEATASVTKSWEKGGIGGYVAKSCEQLHEQIRQLGGP
jgi:hypothetical protein